MFKEFKIQVQKRFSELIESGSKLYLVDVDKDTLWNTYVSSFPDETRQEHNCNSCRQYIKNVGNVVAITPDNKLISMWDKIATGDFKKVSMELSHLVKTAKIKDVFISDTSKIGTDSNVQLLPTVEAQLKGSLTTTWEHLYFVLPKEFVNKSSDSIEAIKGSFRDVKNVFRRSLDEISKDAIDTVLELIAQNSLYRGEEYKGAVEKFLAIKKKYTKLPENEKDNFCWKEAAANQGTVGKIRNTAIGTLLVDVSKGRDLDEAVSAFERIMAPANYKRPNTIITKKMVEEAEKLVDELGIKDSLGRRMATSDDIKVENLIFVDRDIKKSSGIFDELKEDALINPKSYSKVEEVSVEKFVEDILPTAKSVELLLENKHSGNLVTLISPVHPYAKSIFKWSNGFSWSYNNSLADSMKERVKQAGGNVEGVLRFSIQWNEDGKSICDLDAHAIQPDKTEIAFNTYNGRPTSMSGMLDVDMIRPAKVGVENITWSDANKMKHGDYIFFIHNYDSGHNNGFEAQIEFNGEIHSFGSSKKLMGRQEIAVVKYSKDGFIIKPKMESSSTISTRDIWGVGTNKFHKVSMIMNSPNHWEGNIGNRHLFFVIDKAKAEGPVRGFFNEFLTDELLKNKRVFEALGSKLKVEDSEQQLSGVGFSSTGKGEVICKVGGSFSRVLKIKF